MILLDSVIEGQGLPMWLDIIVILFGTIGLFWTKIKSTVEEVIKGKQAITETKLKEDYQEITRLKSRVEILEARELKLIKANTALSTAMIFMIDEYTKASPENTEAIERIRALINENIFTPPDG